MTKETAETTDLLRRFAEVIPSIPAKAVLLLCETTAATIHLRAALLPQPQEPRPEQPSPSGLAGYLGRTQRELGSLLKRLLKDADRDSDVVSITVLSQGPRGDNLRADGAVVIIKEGRYVELFEQWAKRCGLLTPGKTIVDGGEEAEHG